MSDIDIDISLIACVSFCGSKKNPYLEALYHIFCPSSVYVWYIHRYLAYRFHILMWQQEKPLFGRIVPYFMSAIHICLIYRRISRLSLAYSYVEARKPRIWINCTIFHVRHPYMSDIYIDVSLIASVFLCGSNKNPYFDSLYHIFCPSSIYVWYIHRYLAYLLHILMWKQEKP